MASVVDSGGGIVERDAIGRWDSEHGSGRMGVDMDMDGDESVQPWIYTCERRAEVPRPLWWDTSLGMDTLLRLLPAW